MSSQQQQKKCHICRHWLRTLWLGAWWTNTVWTTCLTPPRRRHTQRRVILTAPNSASERRVFYVTRLIMTRGAAAHLAMQLATNQHTVHSEQEGGEHACWLLNDGLKSDRLWRKVLSMVSSNIEMLQILRNDLMWGLSTCQRNASVYSLSVTMSQCDGPSVASVSSSFNITTRQQHCCISVVYEKEKCWKLRIQPRWGRRGHFIYTNSHST